MKRLLLAAGCSLLLLALSACSGAKESTAFTTAAASGKAEPSAAVKALNAKAETYKQELLALGRASADTCADWYTLGGAGITGLITDYIPSFARTDMSLFEIQSGELVYVGPAVEDPENLCVKTAAPLKGLAAAAHPEFYEAVLAMADAFFFQGNQLNYDMTNKRQNLNGLPNDATADRTMYLDCSSYASTVYYLSLVTADGSSRGAASSASTKSFMAEISGGYADAGRPEYAAYFRRSAGSAESWEGGIGKTEKNLDGAAVLEQLKAALQPGDVLVTRKGKTGPDSGHAMLYIGDGYILHSSGTSLGAGVTPETVRGYDTLYSDNSSAAADTPVTGEMANGTVYKTHYSYLFDRGTLRAEAGNPGINRRYLLYDGSMLGSGQDSASAKVWEIGILRPLASGIYTALSAEGEAVRSYPGVTLEKRLLREGKSLYNRTVIPGETLTLELTLENHGPEGFADIPVADGTLIAESVSLGPAGTEEAVRVLRAEYTVPAEAAAGTAVSPRATAGGISSNEVYYYIGRRGEAARREALAPALSVSLADCRTNLEAAGAVYRAAFGTELLQGFDTVSLVQTTLHKNKNYIFSDRLPVVGTLQGGYSLHGNADGKHTGLDYIRRVRPEYLEAGDLIVEATGASVRLFVKDIYLFWDEKTVYRFTENTGSVKLEPCYTDGKSVTAFLTSLYCSRGFMVLRPEP